eukprot:m.79189 g.79189  ORF g.79189 m.79189 type:complete len:101 (-) comp12559_c2_seq2:1396-1698(-)
MPQNKTKPNQNEWKKTKALVLSIVYCTIQSVLLSVFYCVLIVLIIHLHIYLLCNCFLFCYATFASLPRFNVDKQTFIFVLFTTVNCTWLLSQYPMSKVVL